MSINGTPIRFKPTYSKNKSRYNRINIIGVVSGVIGIPKGFSLGATLIDLGAGTRYAAEVECSLMILQSLMRKQKQQLQN